MSSLDSFTTQDKLKIENNLYRFFSLKNLQKELNIDIYKLPNSLKVLLENLLRHEDGENTKKADIIALANCVKKYNTEHEISFCPARVLMQDFTGVPAVVDLASMRDYVKSHNLNPSLINPQVAVDLVIDHSVQVDVYGNNEAFEKNVSLEMERNLERYEFLKWGQSAFQNFRVVPPGTGICHQVNLEYLAKVVWNNNDLVYFDTVVGTDSHTTMVNALSVLGWGVGGIEAEAVMLGQPITMLIPEVIGLKLTGKLSEGVTATDMVLTITNLLRSEGVVNKFVEFCGDGLDNLSISDRATISNMSPEYGATCGFFPIDQKTLDYLSLTGRDKKLISLIKEYAKEQFLWREEGDTGEELKFFRKLELDLSSIKPVMAGPKRPQDKILLSDVPNSIKSLIAKPSNLKQEKSEKKEIELDLVRANNEELIAEKELSTNQDEDLLDNFNTSAAHMLCDGDVVIAAITSCTNTSNPNVMIAAGLVARKANKLGLQSKPWVKTSLAPGSKVVTEYLEKSGLQKDLDSIGFNLVGYGCTTCIGNSGPLDIDIEEKIKKDNLVVAAVLSGNRNFEGRINPFVQANYLASPPLVVLYALAGTLKLDITKDPICYDSNGNAIYFKDLWPTNQEIEDIVSSTINSKMFLEKYSDVFLGDKYWSNIKTQDGDIYNWDNKSTYIRNPRYFDNLKLNDHQSDEISLNNARILAILGDSITTDHISPAGNIAENSPAAKYLVDNGVIKSNFNSYGSRRGNHEVMMRGTFANIRIRNEMVNCIGGMTKHFPTGEEMSIFDASMLYKKDNIPLVIIAGKEYGSGSSRDWAAKGPLLLNVKAVITESFERIHRSNLIGMGILPLTFQNNQNRTTLKLDGSEIISLTGNVGIHKEIDCLITRKDGSNLNIKLKCNINTITEMRYFKSGGVLQYVLLRMMGKHIV